MSYHKSVCVWGGGYFRRVGILTIIWSSRVVLLFLNERTAGCRYHDYHDVHTAVPPLVPCRVLGEDCRRSPLEGAAGAGGLINTH